MYINARAFSIIKYKDYPHIMCRFNHKENKTILAEWIHPITKFYIRNIMPLDASYEFEVDSKDISKCEILLKW